jgi:ABC-type phosphate/phosphonate transport system substrate-binding protein
MEEKKTHMAIMLGYEFAWAQQKYPDLKPLAVAVSNRKFPQALLLVRSDSKIGGLAGLKGKSLALPKKTPGHVRLFLERESKKAGLPLKTQDYPDIESALDDVVRGKLDAVAVEAGSLDNYRLVKPGAAKRLKVVQESALFPPGVIAYREGVLDSDTLKGFRKGLLNAGKNQRSRTLMGLWNIEAFETVPKDFTQTVENIRKVYPATSAVSKVSPEEK